MSCVEIASFLAMTWWGECALVTLRAEMLKQVQHDNTTILASTRQTDSFGRNQVKQWWAVRLQGC